MEKRHGIQWAMSFIAELIVSIKRSSFYNESSSEHLNVSCIFIIILKMYLTQLAGAVEYTDRISAEG